MLHKLEDSMSKIRYLIFFMVLIISIGAAYAADANQTDTALTSQDELNPESAQNGGTFEDIQKEIDSAEEGSAIDLGGNFESTGSEIHINKSVKINGHKNTTLDAKKQSAFFYLDHVPKLEVTGVMFINSQY